METTVVIKCKPTKEITRLANKLTKCHKSGKLITGHIGKSFVEFCKNTIIIM